MPKGRSIFQQPTPHWSPTGAHKGLGTPGVREEKPLLVPQQDILLLKAKSTTRVQLTLTQAGAWE